MAFGNGPRSSAGMSGMSGLSGLSGTSGRSSDAGSDRWAYKLRVKSTFIDVSSDEDGSLSPRAASDPGSVAYAATSHFDLDMEDGSEHYMSELCGTMSQMWGESDKGMSQNSVHDEDDVKACGSDGDNHSGILFPNASDAGSSVVDIMPSLPLKALGQRGLNGKELRRHIKHAAMEVENRIDQRRKRAVLTAIQEIPEQVGDALQKTAMGIVDDVMEEVAAVKDMIEGGSSSERERPGIDSAVAKLEVIPDMIQGSLEAYFSRAERTVRAHMDGMIQNLENDLTSERVVEKMWAIPSEVQAIAKKAMQAAVLESRANAQQQIDNAIASLPNHGGAQQLAGMAESRIMQQVPTDSSVMVEGAQKTVVDAVEQVVAVVKKEDHNIMGVANQVVAETLLRAKVESTSTVAPLEKPPLLMTDMNEGSVGHPELCQRPCLYFARGACANGIGCSYCHLDHSRRPAHPDKKNRVLLKELSFSGCVEVFKPVLKEKLEGLGSGDEVLRKLEDLAAELLATTPDNNQEAPSKVAPAGRHKKQLQQFLRAMTLRSVLALLMRSAPTPQQLAAIEGFTASLRSGPDRKNR